MVNTSNANRIERKKEKTKQNIISAALALFKQNGIDATTMEQICEKADIAKGTLYHYFPVKEAIISEYIRQVSIDKNQERKQRVHALPDTHSRMIFAISELVDGVKERKEIFEKYFVYRIQQMISLERNATHEAGLNLLETEIIKLGQESGEIRDDLPFEILEGLFEFVFIVIVQQFYKDTLNFNAAETIELCVELFMNGARRQ